MHSSRMRTGCSLTVCCCSSGGFSLVPGGGWSAWSRGAVVCLVRGGSPWSRGGGGLFSLVWGGSSWSRRGSPETPPVNRITDMCKNITLATTLLRLVKTKKSALDLFSCYQKCKLYLKAAKA